MTDREKIQAAKDHLCQIPKIDRLIERLTGTVQKLRSSLTSQNYQLREPVKATPRNTEEEIIIKIADLEAQIFDQIEELVDLKRAALDTIRKIRDMDERNILVGKYIDGLKWEIIARQCDHEIRWVFHTHRRALLSFFDACDI